MNTNLYIQRQICPAKRDVHPPPTGEGRPEGPGGVQCEGQTAIYPHPRPAKPYRRVTTRPFRATRPSGYTLLETLLALSLFLAIVLPLMGRIGTGNMMEETLDRHNGSCLLEQETEMVQWAPQSYPPLHRRRVGTREYEIATTREERAMPVYTTTVSRNGRTVAEAVYYVNAVP